MNTERAVDVPVVPVDDPVESDTEVEVQDQFMSSWVSFKMKLASIFLEPQVECIGDYP